MKYYDEDVDKVLASLETSEEGLSTKEAEARLNRYGLNKLKEVNKKSKLSKFLDQFKDMMIVVLLIAAVFSGISSYLNGEAYTDTIVIIAVVLLNAIMGFAQELKAESAVESLKKMTTPNAKVIRNGQVMICSSEKIVPGDILSLEAGDTVPADARVIWEVSSSVDESMLTGESEPIAKDTEKVNSDAQINERINMVYSGCNVVYGKLKAVVVKTGMETELGKIASSVQKDKEVLSPLQIKINNISKVLSIIIAIIIGFVLIYGIAKGNDILEIIMLCISLAVAAIPENLPTVITVTLSLGTTAMAKKNTIVRKISSVETLGSIDIICSDKTGTITQNKMTVKEVIFNNKNYKVEKEPIENSELLIDLMVLCNDSKIDPQNKENLIGDPTETALFKYAMDMGYNPQNIVNENKRVAEVPFDSDRKMMTTINTIQDKIIVATKGSLDSLLKKCTSYYENGNVYELNEKQIQKILNFEKEMAQKSLRVLSFAYKVIKEVPQEEELPVVENNLTFVGLVGMMDPPRETVKESIKTCREAGIRPIMITGDSLSTATAIAKEIGIIEEGTGVIEGKELDKLSDEQLIKEVSKYSVYARVQPEHKVRIVKAWQANNKVVAMTGDGVNDAPAIKLAHVGIGMGKTGTEVTKSVADVILIDDSFSTIVDAVGEGRKIYDNIRNGIIYSLASNFAEILVVIVGLFNNIEIFLPLHILYINLATDSIPSICLAFEKAAKGIMKRKPKPVNAPFFTPFVIASLVVSALFKAVSVLGTYYFANIYYGQDVARTMAFLCMVVQEMVYALNCRNLKEPIVKQGIFSNKAMNIGMLILIVMQLLVFLTPIGSIFEIVPLTLTHLLIIILINIVGFGVIELSKFGVRKFFKDME